MWNIRSEFFCLPFHVLRHGGARAFRVALLKHGMADLRLAGDWSARSSVQCDLRGQGLWRLWSSHCGFQKQVDLSLPRLA
jgi:hypothetical protein